MADQQQHFPGTLSSLTGVLEVDSPLPEALRVPIHRVGTPFVLTLALAQAAVWISLVPIISILLPLQIQGLDAAHKATWLGVVNGVGALVGLLANPLAGAFSDRTTSRFGRRRPWILAGALLTPVCLLLLMSATTIPVLIVGALGLQASLNLTFSALTAILPDQVPVEQRGLASAITGMAAPIASVVGAVLIGSVIQNMTLRYLVTAGIVLLILVPYALLVPDKPLPRAYMPPFHLRTFLTSFWISPRKHPDFGWVWLARCTANLGYYSVSGYLLYYLQDAVHYTSLFPKQSVTQGVAALTVISTVAILVSAFLAGWLSDRFQRRKPFVAAASTLIALGLFAFAFFPAWIGVIIAEVILSLGFGSYLAADQVLATQVLPSERDRAKDMGVINIANILPQTLGSVLAVPILFWTHSYAVLFALTGLIALAGSFVVMQVKSVR